MILESEKIMAGYVEKFQIQFYWILSGITFTPPVFPPPHQNDGSKKSLHLSIKWRQI